MRYPGILSILFFSLQLSAQDANRFLQEIQLLGKKYDTLYDQSREAIVFTGSSSIRLWKELPTLFPHKQIINTGFGGSHTSDLLEHTEQLILKYRPVQVFIYEGDNDIGQEKKPRKILADFQALVKKIRDAQPEIQIVLIAPKPSLKRWHLKLKYRALNRKLKRFCKRDDSLQFADAWSIMLEGREVRPDLFIEDGLHMNQKGYDLWYDLIKPYIH